ncbi:MAG: hypothetical protein C0459_07810 [Chitinophaga sp.]|jgi:Protein of unknown function (DUF3822)|nr:hypothetical protein [Chitinophaga sp.]
MVQKSISSYLDLESQSPFNSDELIVNIGNTYVAMIVRLAGRQDASAFELFEFDKAGDNWYQIFYAVRTQSKILDRSYNNTKVFYNIPENVLVPADKFSANAAENYLSMVHGDNINEAILHDVVDATPAMVNVYRIKRVLFEMVRTNFMMVESKHLYSKILENTIGGYNFQTGNLLKVQFYNKCLLLLLLKNGQLQLIQSYPCASQDDMLYYILSIVQQYGVQPEEIKIELSGQLDTRTQYYDYLRKMFSNIHFETVAPEKLMKELQENYPAHYLSTYFNLA